MRNNIEKNEMKQDEQLDMILAVEIIAESYM